jgi:hypothetical protein
MIVALDVELLMLSPIALERSGIGSLLQIAGRWWPISYQSTECCLQSAYPGCHLMCDILEADVPKCLQKDLGR